MKRVVITGMAGVTPLGSTWQEIGPRLFAGDTAVRSIPEWQDFAGLRSRLGSPVSEWEPPAHFTRKVVRTMGRGAIFGTWAAEEAIKRAGLLGLEVLTSGRAGVAFGSCLGSSEGLMRIAEGAVRRTFEGVPATSFLRVMSHSAAANIALYFNLSGRVLPLCSACTSATQSIGAAVESIRSGAQDVMIAGGCDELCVGLAALFDSMAASSGGFEDVALAPLPFDSRRSGIVIGEGAAALILEDAEHAERRGAQVIAEVVGYATNCNGSHITNPDPDKMRHVMSSALADASIDPHEVGVIHAHATGTELGDIAEGTATYGIFGDGVPVAATKGNLGHTLGACGAIESWLMLEMMHEKKFAPIRGLQNPDPRCAPLAFLRNAPAELDVKTCMVNTFAFGGVNTSLVYRKAD